MKGRIAQAFSVTLSSRLPFIQSNLMRHLASRGRSLGRRKKLREAGGLAGLIHRLQCYQILLGFKPKGLAVRKQFDNL